MRIEYLADHVAHLPQLAKWHHAGFGYLNPGNKVEHYVELLTASMQKSDLPMTFIALQDDQLLGSASLVRETITHRHFSPWLSSVYVDPRYRGRGIASALVGSVESSAAEIGSKRIYLFTPNSEKLYASLGWVLLEDSRYRGLKIAIMSKAPGDAGRGLR